jgi:SulP family sulfate permease
MIAGGFLLYLGLSFLVEWLYDAWFKLPTRDYLLIWLILITIATVGLLEGVALGIVVAVITFAVTYTHSEVVRQTVTGASYQSHVMRPQRIERLLHLQGDSYTVLQLQGFIFFGTAHRLLEQIREYIDNPKTHELRFLLLDFRLVTGIDSSATLSFSRLRQVADNADLTLIMTHLSNAITMQLRGDVLNAAGNRPIKLFPDLDQGVAWCEEQVIADLIRDGMDIQPQTLLQYLDDTLSMPPRTEARESDSETQPELQSVHEARMLTFFERMEVAADTILLYEGQRVNRVFFIERGHVRVQTQHANGQIQQLRVQQAGTVFGEIGIYDGQMATATVVAGEPTLLYRLSAENLARMERQDPELAIAIHRLIAGILGRKLTQANYTIVALQK